MALQVIDVAWRDAALPREVLRLIEDGEQRIDAFIEAHIDDPVFGFVPSDFRRVFQGLRTVMERGLAPGRAMLEWGSGLGVVACMAATLDLDASGIEIHAGLVNEAERLAQAHDLEVEFVCGSYIPPDAEPLTDMLTEFHWLDSGGADAYSVLGFDIEDYDVIFAYPWPGEERVVYDLFEAFASDGALLFTYAGLEDMALHRKR